MNLVNSFPEKTQHEIQSIERKFYRFFCDVFFETVKEMHFTESQIRKRMTYGNTEAILEQNALGKSVMIMTAHYANWEWTLGFPLFLPADQTSNPIYKKQSNAIFDKLFYTMRSKFGAKLIERNELLRIIFRLNNEKKPGNFWMISDQSPIGHKNLHWTTFLNQPTATINGTEQLAEKFNHPVFYADITLIKRGYYHCEFIPVSLDPANHKSEITNKYMQLLERRIQTTPQFWLWSHKRWKHRKE
jgi:KDO2-lipid IV(A) lauroyltransferase